MMHVICAWCKKDMGDKAGPVGETSHGMCLECQQLQLAELRKVREAK